VRRGCGFRFHLQIVGRGIAVLPAPSVAARPVSSRVMAFTRVGVSHSRRDVLRFGVAGTVDTAVGRDGC
jgi:hypothetical protein